MCKVVLAGWQAGRQAGRQSVASVRYQSCYLSHQFAVSVTVQRCPAASAVPTFEVLGSSLVPVSDDDTCDFSELLQFDASILRPASCTGYRVFPGAKAAGTWC